MSDEPNGAGHQEHRDGTAITLVVEEEEPAVSGGGPETVTVELAARAELGHEFVRYGRFIHTFRNQMADLLPAGLDPAAAQLLAWLVKQGPLRLGELAELTLLDPSTVSRRVSQLVHQGLVERRIDQADGRAAQLVPTPHGQELFTTMQVRRQAIVQQVLAGWSAGDLNSLTALLRKFNDDFEVYRCQQNAPTTALRVAHPSAASPPQIKLP